jgi:alpha-L-fucosidase 2
VIAAATSYRRYDDVAGDPTALNQKTLTALDGKLKAQVGK